MFDVVFFVIFFLFVLSLLECWMDQLVGFIGLGFHSLYLVLVVVYFFLLSISPIWLFPPQGLGLFAF